MQSDDFTAFLGQNIIEKIILEFIVKANCQCTTVGKWCKLDDVLATRFPKLSQVTLHINICASSSDDTTLQEKLNKLPEEQFPLLSKNPVVMFDFLVEISLLWILP